MDQIVQGKGTSNTGNVARRFFENYTKISQITELNESILKRTYILLLCTSSTTSKINIEKYKEFAKKLAKDYLEMYSFVNISPSFHKLMFHSPHMAQLVDEPLGRYSEENVEVNHQIVKKAKRHHIRRDSRAHGNIDLQQRFLVESDPLISTLRDVVGKKRKQRKKKSPLLRECSELLGKYLKN